jgi:hypothetical protein
MQSLFALSHGMRFRQHEALFVLCLIVTLLDALAIYTPWDTPPLPLLGLVPGWPRGKPTMLESKHANVVVSGRRFPVNRTDPTWPPVRRARARSPRARNADAEHLWIFS